MGICIKKVFVKNYKSLKDMKIDFDHATVFMGKNNSGKSNIIKCLETAFNYSNAEKEDIYCSPQNRFEYDRVAVIDVLIIPANTNGEREDLFDDVWGRKFGDAISVDENSDKEFFAFRTEISYDTDKEIFINQKYKIDKWDDEGNHTLGSILKRETINGIEVVSIPAQRDISHDIRDRKSIWGRLVSKIKITPEVEKKIERQLSKLNKDIVKESDLLQNIASELKNTTGEKTSTVEITPITKDIDSLYKGMDIIYTDNSSLPTSVENLGLGVRSWAVFSTVKAEVSAKNEKAIQEEYAYFPLVLIEEPEAHVHPQAQRQLFSMLLETTGQKVITTHSPYILSQTNLDSIRHIRKPQSYSEIVPLLTEGLLKDDVRKIKRSVMNTRGEIFYSNCVILAEGETEEQALTVFLRSFFDKEPYELGINVVGVGGGAYLPFLKVLSRLKIQWFIFSDGEDDALKNLKSAIKELYGLRSIRLSDYPNVIYLENKQKFETHCLENGYLEEINIAIDLCEDEDEYITWYINHYDQQKGKGGNVRNYKSDADGGVYRATLDCILGGKTKYPAYIAEQIVSIDDETRRFPPKIKELMEKVSEFIDESAGDRV